ncbi:MAG: hypothetical protein R3307_01840, partial [Anaerolineales bacterium]|nr:hypothetical protein [Anaerolineales bacterium]
SQIIPDPKPGLPDIDIFGSEPAHTWCYFFQKADLARQTEDWEKVLVLFEEAQQLGFTPKFGAEYIPLIEAHAQTGDWQKAYDLTIAAAEMTPGLKRMMCANWVRLSRLPSADIKTAERVDQTFSC